MLQQISLPFLTPQAYINSTASITGSHLLVSESGLDEGEAFGGGDVGCNACCAQRGRYARSNGGNPCSQRHNPVSGGKARCHAIARFWGTAIPLRCANISRKQTGFKEGAWS
jgi:hypothetical protein